MNKSKLFSLAPYLRWLEHCLRLFKPTASNHPLPLSSPQTHRKLAQLHTKAEQINQLSAQLEARIWELKTIASQINQDRHLSPQPQTPTPICTYRTVKLPKVQQKANHFVLTSHPLDLFQAERDAFTLAKTLRQRAQKKRRRRKS